MKNRVFLLLKSLVILAAWNSAAATSSVEREQNKKQLLDADGMSQRLLKDSNPNPTFARIFYLGAYHEFLFGPIHAEYNPSVVGVIAGFQHTLNSYLRGGLELHWSHWQAKDKNNSPRYIMPVGLYSKIILQPKFSVGAGSLAPYLTAGLGYMIPFQGDSYFAMNVPASIGMVMFIGGGGIEWMFVKSFGITMGFDTWLDLEGKDFFAGDLSLSLVSRF